MTPVRNATVTAEARLSEDDPIPPEDPAVTAPGLALDDLYRSEGPKLLRFFRRRIGEQDSQDLLQESFARLAKAEEGRDQAIVRPEAFLNRIASNMLKNRALSAYERAKGNSMPVEDADLSAPDLLRALEARDMIHRVQTALMRLSPKTRDIFLAHRVDGLSYEEIAQRVGLSKKGVDWHMTKAIAHLNRSLRSRW